MKIIKNEYGAKAELKRKFYKAFCFITRKKLIIDVTGTILTPGNEGHGCRGKRAARPTPSEFYEHNRRAVQIAKTGFPKNAGYMPQSRRRQHLRRPTHERMA